jgi:hypothetical protein
MKFLSLLLNLLASPIGWQAGYEKTIKKKSELKESLKTFTGFE